MDGKTYEGPLKRAHAEWKADAHLLALAAFAREVIENDGASDVRYLAAKRDLVKWTKQGYALADWLKAIPEP